MLLLPFSFAWAQEEVLINIRAGAPPSPVSPYIYGMNNVLSTNPTQPVSEAVWKQTEDAGVTLIRSCGGNNLTKYNWRKKITSHPDWYNNVYTADWDYAMESLTRRLPQVQSMWGFQLIGKSASVSTSNFNDWDYNRSAWWSGVSQNLAGGGIPDAGGGNKAAKEGNPDLYLQQWNADSTVAILDYWYKTKGISKEQTRFWSMDNEPEIWNGTHDDIMPVQCSADEFMQRYFEVAKKARLADPDIRLVGPVTANEWQWFKYAQDTKIDGVHYCWLEYFIKRCAEEEKKTGLRLLDVLSIHFYPSETEAGQILQLHRIFFDETYVYPGANGIKTLKGGWDNSLTREYIFARCNQWLTTYFGENHGIGLGLCETGIQSSNANVTAVWYASHLGEFMKHGVTLFTPWDWKPGMYEVLHLNTRYNKKLSIPAESSREELVSAYATINSGGDSLSVLLVNRSETETLKVRVRFGSFIPSGSSQPLYTLSNLPRLTETFVAREMNAVKESAATAQEGEYILSLLPLSVNTLVLEGALQTGINVDSSSDSDFYIFPNPVSNVLHVQSKKPALLRILSMQGNCLATQNIDEPGNHTFSIADYPKGTYILSALDRWGNQTTKKFIIK